MKKTALCIFALALTACAPATAQTVYATITSIEPRYETVWENQTQCQDVQVPIYGTVQGGGANGGDVLAGMIIGGLLGKGATGNDRGAAAGAVLGGVIAGDGGGSRQVITGYQWQTQCNQVAQQTRVNRIKNYFIQFQWNGHSGSAYTYNNYNVGQTIPATVSVKAN